MMENALPLSFSPLLTGKRIVIVEGETITRILLNRLVTLAGLIVVGETAYSAEALRLVTVERPDIVLLDMGLEDPGGIETTGRIRQLLPTCRIVWTGHYSPASHRQSLDAGAAGLLSKPLTSDILILSLEKFCTQAH